MSIIEPFMESIVSEPVAGACGVAMTMTWLRIVGELVEAGLPWEDAICVCTPTEVAHIGLVTGFRFAHRDLAADVVGRWDVEGRVEREVRAGVDAFRDMLAEVEDDGEDDRLIGLAMYSSILREIPPGAAAARDQGLDAEGYALAILAAVEVKPDAHGFPVEFCGHGEATEDTLSLQIPRLHARRGQS